MPNTISTRHKLSSCRNMQQNFSCCIRTAQRMLCCETMSASDMRRKLTTTGRISAHKSANVQRSSDPLIPLDSAKYHVEESQISACIFRGPSKKCNRKGATHSVSAKRSADGNKYCPIATLGTNQALIRLLVERIVELVVSKRLHTP